MSASRFARYCHTNGPGPHECENDCGNMLSAESCRNAGYVVVCADCGRQYDEEAALIADMDDADECAASPDRVRVYANDSRDPRQDADDRDLRAE